MFSLCSCGDKHDVNPTEAAHQKVNDRLYDYFDEAYLWNTQIPRRASLQNTLEPESYFEKLRYLPDDKWSVLFQNSDQVSRMLENEESGFGYGLAFGVFSNTGSYFAVVTHVYANSPAETAGLKRGDLIIGINRSNITDANVEDLWYASSLTLTLGKLMGSQIAEDREVSVQASTQYNDPVISIRILSHGQHKIGYLCYTNYVEQSESRLTEVFTGFRAAGVTDVVLDLRYNSGGLSTTGIFLSSILAPATALNGSTVYLTESWNDFYNDYYDSEGYDRKQYFKQDIPVNMDLERIFILTSGQTASASEGTIVGLTPYMDVITIGDSTHGKYCGAAFIETLDKEDDDLKQWGMMLVVYRFVNRDGLTDFKEGLAPTFSVPDDLFEAYPFGDERDPQLAKAIELITGNLMPAVAVAPITRSGHYRMLSGDHDFRHPVKKSLITRIPER